MPYLRHSVNGSALAIYEIKDTLSIGRSRDNYIVVEDPTVSQHHASVKLENGVWVLLDCGSTNGVRIKGEKKARCILQDGATFTLGAQSFEFTLVEPDQLDKTLEIKKSWIPGVYYTK